MKIPALLQRLAATLTPRRKNAADADLDTEIAFHLDAALADNLRAGMDPAEARRQALLRFGPVAQARELQREARGIPLLDTFLQDLKFTFRTLTGRRERTFAAIVTLVLALGIGANVAVFGIVNTILLRPLPFRDPHQLVWFAGNQGRGGLSDQTYTVAAFEEFRKHNRSFQDVTSFQTFFNSIQYKLTNSTAEPINVVGVPVAENFFPTLGVEPALGRLFQPEECRKGGRAAVLLSHAFWQRQFAGDPAIIGRVIHIETNPADIPGPFTVVGVMPASFDFGAVFSPGLQVDFYTPAIMDFWRTWGNTVAIVGRLKPGVSVSQAHAEAAILFPQLRAANRDWWSDYKSKLSSLHDHVSGRLRRSLYALWAAVGLILFIVCINVSNLLLSRTMARGKEFAMRTALGAGRSRLIAQLLTESLVLTGTGAILGLALAWTLTAYLASQSHFALPLLATARLDLTMIAWTLAVTVAAALIFGLTPALRIATTNLQDILKDNAGSASQGRSHERLRSTLVISEVALACILLVGSGLLLRSFIRILDVDLGFQPANVAAMQVELSDSRKAERRGIRVREILERVRAIPGVEAAGMTDMLPLDRNRSWSLTSRENLTDKTVSRTAFVYVVSPGYLEAMGMRLRQGRDIDWSDRPEATPALVINEAAVRREWPKGDPVGQSVPNFGKKDGRVVGVIADVRESNVEDHASVQMYLPMSQFEPEGAELVVRTRLSLAAIEPAVVAALKEMNPGQPRTQFRPIQRIVDHAVSPRRLLVILVTAFAAFGLLLASLGIYGVISYSVSRQAQEIGIRMALGATSSQVQLSILRQTLKLTTLGIAVGSLAAYAAAKAIAALLFNTEPADPLIFAAMIGLLTAVALLAGHLPARRASRIDPMLTLRGV